MPASWWQRLLANRNRWRLIDSRKWFRSDLPFGFLKVPPNLNLSSGTSQWLVNYDWSDNGLQVPFRDQGLGEAPHQRF